MAIPRLVYGTAWKEERTEALARAALDAGFRGIDTANQRRHYHEAAVGAAIRGALASGLAREDLFVQTKFTYARGQDHRLPYDPRAPIARQVGQSFASSLEHLGLETIDAYLLHGPSGPAGISADDLEAWGAMEALHQEGYAKLLGLSNVSAEQLAELHARASVKPRVVQNRTFTRPRADLDVRSFCREHDIAYEGFSLLTAIPGVLAHPILTGIAARTGRTPAQLVFQWCLAEGLVVLTGTSSPQHMRQDLEAATAPLAGEDRAAIGALVGSA